VFTSALGVPARTRELRAESHEGLQSYLRAQHRLWFGVDIPDDFADPRWRFGLAEQWLKPLPFFQNLLKVLGGRPRGIDAILAELARRTTLPAPTPDHPTYHADLVGSIAALASAARLPAPPGSEEKTRPFIDVRVQLWIRELRRMVSTVGPSPELRFSDDLSDGERALHLPVVHCLGCDSTGWASLLAAGESALRTDLRDFYIAFFGRDPRVTFLFPIQGAGKPRIGFERGHTYLMCGNCLTLGANPEAGRCGSCGHSDALTRVFVPDNKRSVSRRDGTTHLEGNHDCPFCHSRNGFTVIGSQAASLTSVMLGSLFATPLLRKVTAKSSLSRIRSRTPRIELASSGHEPIASISALRCSRRRKRLARVQHLPSWRCKQRGSGGTRLAMTRGMSAPFYPPISNGCTAGPS
jgi:DEAD/DEAH box helicase domain-containing protein